MYVDCVFVYASGVLSGGERQQGRGHAAKRRSCVNMSGCVTRRQRASRQSVYFVFGWVWRPWLHVLGKDRHGFKQMQEKHTRTHTEIFH